MPSVYEIVTEKIIKQLESGVAPWRKPWTSQTPANLVTHKEYRGLNVFTLASQVRAACTQADVLTVEAAQSHAA